MTTMWKRDAHSGRIAMGGEDAVKRFYYSAIRNQKECEGVIRADSIDSAKRKLLEEGYEEITLSILSSLPLDFDEGKHAEKGDPAGGPPGSQPLA